MEYWGIGVLGYWVLGCWGVGVLRFKRLAAIEASGKAKIALTGARAPRPKGRFFAPKWAMELEPRVLTLGISS